MKSRKGTLREILGALAAYHCFDKRHQDNILPRQQYLLQISTLAGNYLRHFNVDMDYARQRHSREKSDISELVRRKQEKVEQEPLDRNILTLRNRSLRKREYLQKLLQYCKDKQYDDFNKYVTGPGVAQDTSHGLIGIHQSNQAESEDFAHREGFKHGALATAFQEWVVSDSFAQHVHFFLWLESHPICIAQNRTLNAYKEVLHVRYYEDRNTIPDEAKFHILSMSGGLLKAEAGRVMDTYQAGYQTESRKSIAPDNAHSNGIAAFVWSPSEELFIGQHYAGKFHHSSLLAGARVKCAGMIGIRGGKIVELSNNSGHYKPSMSHMRQFMSAFRSAFAANHLIRVTTGPNSGEEGNIDTLLGYNF
ncbi:MAG: hypothetical protein GQ582_04590 [Methyloprofundus sp.]|nr:hypothetical protein [Methyloprofundus sp.]